jgi:hypothetical protein
MPGESGRASKIVCRPERGLGTIPTSRRHATPFGPVCQALAAGAMPLGPALVGRVRQDRGEREIRRGAAKKAAPQVRETAWVLPIRTGVCHPGRGSGVIRAPARHVPIRRLGWPLVAATILWPPMGLPTTQRLAGAWVSSLQPGGPAPPTLGARFGSRTSYRLRSAEAKVHHAQRIRTPRSHYACARQGASPQPKRWASDVSQEPVSQAAN